MTSTLSPSQTASLFDILTHFDTYDEIRDFRYPGALKHYGPPFTVEPSQQSTAPALQTLVTRFLLTLPGLNNLHNDFWKVQVYDIIENLEKSNLSESYDKGVIGSRKTLATAISALIEYPLRGTYGGFAEVDTSNRHYDTTKADDLVRAFRDFMNECIYGTVLEDLVEKAAKTDQLEDHDALMKAVHEFMLVNLASFMHYTLVLSPKGQYLLKLVDNANRLVPYMMIKQTLKIGNIATMIQAMMKIVLAKMSVTSVTNWIGITASQDNGLNLLQYIISTVLHWDIKDFESRASKIERERAKPGKEQLKVLKEYASKPRSDQERARHQSEKQSISIVTAILQETTLESQLTEPHHASALEYLSIALSIRDRKEIINVLCHSHPDHLTQSVREVIDAYEPVIRHMHNAINLSGTVGDMEYFIKDMIKLAVIKPDKSGTPATVPSVGDFIMLLRKHQFSSHTFIHQICKNGPEVTSWYLAWAKTAALQFRRDNPPTTEEEKQGAAGDLTDSLQQLFTSLPSEMQRQIIPVLDQQTSYIEAMHANSHARLVAVLKSPPSKNPTISKIFSASSRPASRASSPAPGGRTAGVDIGEGTSQVVSTGGMGDVGPGAYLARWADLLEKTEITPSEKEVDGEVRVGETGGESAKPDVRIVIDAFGGKFRALLAEKGCIW